MTRGAQRRRQRRPQRTALGILSAFVLFFATSATWIGGLIAFQALGIPIQGDEWLGWVLAALIAVAVWPLAGRRAHRAFCTHQHHAATPRKRPRRRRIAVPASSS